MCSCFPLPTQSPYLQLALPARLGHSHNALRRDPHTLDRVHKSRNLPLLSELRRRTAPLIRQHRIRAQAQTMQSSLKLPVNHLRRPMHKRAALRILLLRLPAPVLPFLQQDPHNASVTIIPSTPPSRAAPIIPTLNHQPATTSLDDLAHDLPMPVLSRIMQRRLAVLVLAGDVAAPREQELHDSPVACLGRSVQRCLAVFVVARVGVDTFAQGEEHALDTVEAGGADEAFAVALVFLGRDGLPAERSGR